MDGPLRIVATRHEDGRGVRVLLGETPVAIVPLIDSIFGVWWYRAGGYPAGRFIGTRLDARNDG